MKVCSSLNNCFSVFDELKTKVANKFTPNQVIGIVGVVASIAQVVFGALLLPTPVGIALACAGVLQFQVSVFAATGALDHCLKQLNS